MNRPEITALAKAVVSPFHSFLLLIDYGFGPHGVFSFYLGKWTQHGENDWNGYDGVIIYFTVDHIVRVALQDQGSGKSIWGIRGNT